MDRLGLADRALPKGERGGEWRETITREPTDVVDVALVGKYGLEDAYISIHEALKHAGFEHAVEVNRHWVHSEKLIEGDGNEHEIAGEIQLGEMDAIVVPGGFGSRGTEGKIEAVRYARENDVPYLGLCLGFQIAVIEYARSVLGLEGAHSAEIDEDTPHPVIDILPEQKEIEDKGGTMRLGVHETDIRSGTLAHEIYNAGACTERHRHRYEVNPEYIEALEDAGLRFSGRSGRRMEILELPDHPYFIGTQFHPEFRSRPTRASPPFVGLVDAVLAERREEVEV
jgi:CTP synthase